MNADARSAVSFLQFQHLGKPVFAVIAAVWLLVAVAELDMVSPCRGRWTRHVTQWAFVVAHCAIKRKTKTSNWHKGYRGGGHFFKFYFYFKKKYITQMEQQWQD